MAETVVNSFSIPPPSPPNIYSSSSDLRIFIDGDGDGDGDFDLTLDSVDDLYFPWENESFVIPVDSTLSSSSKMVMDQKVKVEEEVITKKRKKEMEEDESRNNKYRRSNHEEDGEKRNVRLIRNRESANLSRQRKKHYVEELEEKVKKMESMIMDLNSKISYFMAENVAMRQQVGSGSVRPLLVPMAYHPWLHCPGYMVKPQGYSQVPLLPIPRLKPQQSLAKVVKRKMTKKVASVSVLGLLFCMFLFGALVYDQSRGRVLDVFEMGRDVTLVDNLVPMRNDSESLAASLYVPRNEKLVKMDGNLIIRYILASEKAMASETKSDGAKDVSLALPSPGFTKIRNMYKQKREARSSSSSDDTFKDQLNGTRAYVEMQQWFREGVAGPMFSSGMCTEVFLFDVSSTSGAIPTSIVVSLLVDSREGGNGDINGLSGGTKSLSTIFIVLLVDGVKYVTYSCVLPQPKLPDIETT